MARGSPAGPGSRTDERPGRRRRVVAVLVWWCLVAAVVVVSGRIVAAQRADPQVTVGQMSSARHVNGPVSYPQHPPTSGDHHPIWWDCGVYDEPVPLEHAVHSLEHGAVWITYRPDVQAEAASLLPSLAGRSHVLVSPLPDQDGAVVATAWGVQRRFPALDLDALRGFVAEHRLGPLAPESGALCSNGTTRDLVDRGSG